MEDSLLPINVENRNSGRAVRKNSMVNTTRTIRVSLGNGSFPVDHFEWTSLSSRIESHLDNPGRRSLTISSVNLDHLRQYRQSGLPGEQSGVTGKWLYVADGWPVAWRAAKAANLDWPRLAGSDILPEVLRLLNERGGSIAVVGGTPDMHDRLQATASTQYPNVEIAGMWAPSREELTADPQAIGRSLSESDPDVVLVSLPKPLSERWISRNDSDGKGRLYLPFGAAADFLSGHIQRAPQFMRRFGMEWLFRLLLEPRRMARRYLVEAPTTFRILLGPAVIESTET